MGKLTREQNKAVKAALRFGNPVNKLKKQCGISRREAELMIADYKAGIVKNPMGVIKMMALGLATAGLIYVTSQQVSISASRTEVETKLETIAGKHAQILGFPDDIAKIVDDIVVEYLDICPAARSLNLVIYHSANNPNIGLRAGYQTDAKTSDLLKDRGNFLRLTSRPSRISHRLKKAISRLNQEQDYDMAQDILEAFTPEPHIHSRHDAIYVSNIEDFINKPDSTSYFVDKSSRGILFHELSHLLLAHYAEDAIKFYEALNRLNIKANEGDVLENYVSQYASEIVKEGEETASVTDLVIVYLKKNSRNETDTKKAIAKSYEKLWESKGLEDAAETLTYCLLNKDYPLGGIAQHKVEAGREFLRAINAKK